jgi:hypothetical protein
MLIGHAGLNFLGALGTASKPDKQLRRLGLKSVSNLYFVAMLFRIQQFTSVQIWIVAFLSDQK